MKHRPPWNSFAYRVKDRRARIALYQLTKGIPARRDGLDPLRPVIQNLSVAAALYGVVGVGGVVNRALTRRVTSRGDPDGHDQVRARIN